MNVLGKMRGKRTMSRNALRLAACLLATALAMQPVWADRNHGLPTYGESAGSAVPNPFVPGLSSGDTPACPHVCLILADGESEADAIARFERENHCTVSPDDADAGSEDEKCTEAWRGDEDFLGESEGSLVLEGYVPVYTKDVKDKKGNVIHKKGDVIGASGVTISTGVDLGPQSSAGTRTVLDNYIKEKGNDDNVDVDALMKKLDPYFGERKQDALDALAAQSLSVTEEEARLLADAFKFDTQTKVAKQFDKNNTEDMTFKKLPEEAQTVIIDFAYQYGLADSKGVRKEFWDYVYAGDWQGLATWLKGNPDAYKSRRKREGDHLQAGIDAGSLPATGDPCAATADTPAP
jgi:hypothetical protein